MQAAGLEELTRLVKEDGYKGVRFNPYLWPEGEPMTNQVGKAMYQRCGPAHGVSAAPYIAVPCFLRLDALHILFNAPSTVQCAVQPSQSWLTAVPHSSAAVCRAGELGVPVGHMTFKGLLNHIDDITALCQEFPDTKVIIDHFGFCSAAKPDGPDWEALFGLARYPQVYVKVTP